jgi:hypothetical protein
MGDFTHLPWPARPVPLGPLNSYTCEPAAMPFASGPPAILQEKLLTMIEWARGG